MVPAPGTGQVPHSSGYTSFPGAHTQVERSGLLTPGPLGSLSPSSLHLRGPVLLPTLRQAASRPLLSSTKKERCPCNPAPPRSSRKTQPSGNWLECSLSISPTALGERKKIFCTGDVSGSPGTDVFPPILQQQVLLSHFTYGD